MPKASRLRFKGNATGAQRMVARFETQPSKNRAAKTTVEMKDLV